MFKKARLELEAKLRAEHADALAKLVASHASESSVRGDQMARLTAGIKAQQEKLVALEKEIKTRDEQEDFVSSELDPIRAELRLMWNHIQDIERVNVGTYEAIYQQIVASEKERAQKRGDPKHSLIRYLGQQ